MGDGLEFVIYSKSNAFRQQVAGVDARAVLIPNDISTAEFTVDDDDPVLKHVTFQGESRGARCAVWFRGVERFRGRIDATPGDGPDGSTTVSVEGDMRKLWDWYGWPVPSAVITAQNAEYRNYTGRVETALKTALQENLTRLGASGYSVASTLGRGPIIPATAPISMRFHLIGDKFMPAVRAAGLVAVISYHPTTGAATFDLRTANTVTGFLTVESGVADSYQFIATAPTATRAIVGGRGEGVAREFKQYIDTVREADWGDIIETFVDARNTDVGVDILPEAVAAVAEGAPAAGFAGKVVETDRFKYGKTFIEGDFVNVAVGPVNSREQITSVEIADDTSTGVTVTPHIGSADVEMDTETSLVASIAALARGQRDLGRR